MSREDILPLHLELEILRRLPTKSVLRFRCVQKSWNVATRESRFVNSHLSRPTKETTYFVTELGKGTKNISVGVSSDPQGDLFQGAFTTTNWIESRTNPCNGLICFSTSTYTSQGAHQILSYICNPSSEEYVQLPIIVKHAQHRRNMYCICGLGFDTHWKLFKVVMFEKVVHQITGIFLCTVPLDGDPPQPWRRIYGAQVPNVMVPLTSTLVNARLHWLMEETTTNLKGVISLDMHDEQLRLMPFKKIKTNIGCYIAEFGGSLALVNFLEPVPNMMHVWVMNEYGNDDSWTLRVSIPISYWPSLHGIRFSWETDGDFFVYLASRIFSYNPKKQVVVDHNIVGNIKFVVPFQSSLVSLAKRSFGTSILL